MQTWPMLSVIVPARDDAATLPATVEAILAQQYPGSLEIILAVGPSADDTAEVAAELAAADERLRVVDNPHGTTSSALNIAIGVARGPIIARMDAHAEPTPGYLELVVVLLEETGAANVGGIQLARGTTHFQQAVATAMTSRFGTGDAKFHYGGEPGPTDTVYLGSYRRDVLERLGGFDESLLRNQDYELNVRLRERDEVVWFDPRLKVIYRPRATLRSLLRQYYDYGRWKRLVVHRHPRSLRWRQLLPPATVLANALGFLCGLAGFRRGLIVPGLYISATAVASLLAGWRQGPHVVVRLPLAFAAMHHAWGVGFLIGVRPEQHAPTGR